GRGDRRGRAPGRGDRRFDQRSCVAAGARGRAAPSAGRRARAKRAGFQDLHPDPAFEAALGQVPPALAAALEQEEELDRLVPALLGPRAIVLGRGFNFSTAEEIALKLTETSYVLARAWSVADFEHGPIAVVDPGFPVLLVDGRGPVSGDLESIGRRLRDQSC